MKFSRTTLPLTNFMKKAANFEWNPQCEEACLIMPQKHGGIVANQNRLP